MATKLKRVLEDMGLSTPKAARLAGMDRANLSRVLNGVQRPYPDWRRRLARLVGVPEDQVDSLFVEEGQETLLRS